MEFLTQQEIVRVPANLVKALILTIKTISFSDLSFSRNFPFSFGQTQCSSRLNSFRQVAFTTSANVPVISLETSHSSIRSSCYDQPYDQISFKMFVQGMPIHPPDSRPQNIPFTDASHYGRGAHLEPKSLSFLGRWSEDQSQLHINMLEIMAILFALIRTLKIYSPFLCHDFYRQHNSGLIYQRARRNTFSQPMCGGMEDSPIVPKTSYCHQDSSYPRQIQCFGRQFIENRQNSQNRVGTGSIDSKFNFFKFSAIPV